MIFSSQVNRALQGIMDNGYTGYLEHTVYNDYRGMCSVMRSLRPLREQELVKKNHYMATFKFEAFDVVIHHLGDKNNFKILC